MVLLVLKHLLVFIQNNMIFNHIITSIPIELVPEIPLSPSNIENFKYRIIYLNYDTRRFNTIFKRKPKNRRLE